MTNALAEILEAHYQRALQQPQESFITNNELAGSIERICRYLNNRAPVRFLIACTLAKIDNPAIDIRAPYTEIDDPEYHQKKYSGRSYDESAVERFVLTYKLPVNPTTAFLTPAFRTKHFPLLVGTDLGGRRWEKQYYDATLRLLHLIEQRELSPSDLLAEIFRNLVQLREENALRMMSLLSEMQAMMLILGIRKKSLPVAIHGFALRLIVILDKGRYALTLGLGNPTFSFLIDPIDDCNAIFGSE